MTHVKEILIAILERIADAQERQAKALETVALVAQDKLDADETRMRIALNGVRTADGYEV